MDRILLLLFLVCISSCNVETKKVISRETAFLCGGLKTFISTTKNIYVSVQMVPIKNESFPSDVSNFKLVALLQTDLLANKYKFENNSKHLKMFLQKLSDVRKRTENLNLKDLKLIKEEMNSYIRFLDNVYNDYCGTMQISIRP